MVDELGNPLPTGGARPSWGDAPAETRMPSIPIVRAVPGHPWRGWIISDRLTYVGTHMVDGRTVPHLLPVEACPGCRTGQEIRGRGYLACLDVRSRRVVLAEVTDRAIRYCPDLVDRSASLRGRFLRLWRSGKSDRSQVVAVVEAGQPMPDAYREPDVRGQLLHIWGAPNRQARADQGSDDSTEVPLP